MIPFLKRFRKNKQVSYFLVLVLKNEKVSAAIFEEEETKIKVIGAHEEHFKESIERDKEEEFLNILDKAISKAEEILPENIETQKTIFGVKEDWTEGNKIKKEYLLRLKRVSDSLGLIPVGFLIIPEAIAHLIEKEEGAPISAIFVEPGKKFVTISLVKTGKIIETKTSEINESVVATVDTLLKHFETPEILPSRIIICDQDENLNQEFVSHQWSKSLPFLHLPQITSLPAGSDAKAVLVGAASQMGFEILAAENTKNSTEDTEIEKDDNPKETTNDSVISAVASFGFEKEKDVAKTYLQEKLPIPHKSPEEPLRRMTQEDREDKTPKISPFISIIKNVVLKISVLFKKIAKKEQSLPAIPTETRKINKKVIIFPLVIIFVFLAIPLLYVFLIHTTVTLSIAPKIVERNENVIFTTDNIPTSSNNIIGGQLVSVTEEGEISTKASGKKEIGDKAKGTITVFNNSDVTKTLLKGTMMITTNTATNLQFVFTNDVTVASASSTGDDFSGKTTIPGKANVNVEASDIGQEYNLPSGIKFSLGSNPLLVAKNDNPFSGGTKKEVTVVSKNDTDKLLGELPKVNEQKAKDDLLKNLPASKKLLSVFLKTEIGEKKFDKNVGDTASQVSLKGNVFYEMLSYNQSDLIAFARRLIENKIPSNLTVNYNDIKIEAKEINKQNDKELDVSLNIKSLLVPKIDQKTITQELAGLSYLKAKEKLLKIPLVKDIKISSSFTMPFYKIVSKTPNNIKIQLKIND